MGTADSITDVVSSGEGEGQPKAKASVCKVAGSTETVQQVLIVGLEWAVLQRKGQRQNQKDNGTNGCSFQLIEGRANGDDTDYRSLVD